MALEAAPLHNVCEVGVIVKDGVGLMVTVLVGNGVDDVQPLLSVTET